MFESAGRVRISALLLAAGARLAAKQNPRFEMGDGLLKVACQNRHSVAQHQKINHE